jgi:hypothetical protein
VLLELLEQLEILELLEPRVLEKLAQLEFRALQEFKEQPD